MAKLDPGLKYLAASEEADWSHIAQVSTFSVDVLSPGAARARVFVEVEEDTDTVRTELTRVGFALRARAGKVFSGDISLNTISQLAQVPGVTRAEASRVLWPELDSALPEADIAALHNPPHGPARGALGIIVGIIDSGIDYSHPSFQNAAGSRILAIWDQAAVPAQAGDAAPAGYSYGVEYRQARINAALTLGAPAGLVPHVDPPPFHGTHVAGIAAGNGEPIGAAPSGGVLRYVGVAPDAELIVVANMRGQAQNQRGLGDSTDAIDALNYILDFANGLERPVVINMSQGDNLGPHDGTGLLEAAITYLITGPGRVLIKSAGNEGNQARHAQGILVAGRSQDVTIDVFGDSAELIVDLWYPGADRIGSRITPPSGPQTVSFDPPFNNTVPLGNGNVAFVDADLNDPGNGDNRTFVILRNGTQAFVEKGVWTLRLTGTGAWHAWIQRPAFAVFQDPFLSPATTISIPGTSRGAISVGCYVNSGGYVAAPPGSLSELSSRGPTRDGRRAPTLSAPGEELMSQMPEPIYFGAMKGTSMSAPMVAGAAALMLAFKKTLTADDIRRCLEQTARVDSDTGVAPNNDFGAGKLDINGACNCAKE